MKGVSLVDELKNAIRKRIPSGDELARLALRDHLGENHKNPEWIKANFSDLVVEVQSKLYKKYLTFESPAGAAAIKDVFLPMAGKNGTAKDLIEIISKSFHDLDRLFLSLTQSRRQRAGAAFEYVIREMFEVLGYPFTSQAVINGKPDFVLPSITYYERNAMDCIIFTVKRTLRERWRQIVTEGTRGLGFYLATIDMAVSNDALVEMKKSRIYMVVPKAMKENIKAYKDAVNVISFEEFFAQHLDPAMVRWRKRHIIPG
jgi:hypothetical protein